jgi:hypothetical protein
MRSKEENALTILAELPEYLLSRDSKLTLILVTPQFVETFLHHAGPATLHLLRRGGNMSLSLATF